MLDLQQHFKQSIIHIITYLKTLKKQWIDFIQNFVWILFLTQIFHLYIRRELIYCQIDTINQREIRKITWDIETIEFMLTHLKRKNNDNHNTSDFDLKQHRIRNNIVFKTTRHKKTISSLRLSCQSRSPASQTIKNSTNWINLSWKKEILNEIKNLKARHFKISFSRVIIVTI